MTGPSAASGQSSAPTYSLPDPTVVGFEALASLTDDEYRALEDAVRASEPAAEIRSYFIAISQASGIEFDPVRQILQAALSAAGLAARERLSSDALAASFDLSVLDLSRDDADRLRQRVAALVGTRSVQLTSRTMESAFGDDRVYLGSRIRTSLRPVFTDEQDAEIGAAVIVHELTIAYVHDGQQRTVTVALDASDLRLLKKSVDGAMRQADALQASMIEAKIPTIRLYEEDPDS